MNRLDASKVRLVGFLGIAIFLMFTTVAMAQEEVRSQVSLQGTGLVAKDSSGQGISQEATKSGGFLVGYSFQLNRWASAEANYGYSRNTQSYSGNFGRAAIQANVHEITGAFVLNIPANVPKVRPYVLAGGGALVFDPTRNAGGFVSGAESQGKAVFLYGGGVNFDITRNVGFRAEYRGLVYKTPDFQIGRLDSDKFTHLAQPSAGIFFRF